MAFDSVYDRALRRTDAEQLDEYVAYKIAERERQSASDAIDILERVQHRLWEASERTECGSPEEKSYLDAYEHVRVIRLGLETEQIQRK